MAGACMATKGIGSFIFIDDITAVGSSKINSEVFGHLIGTWLILQQHDIQFFQAKFIAILEWPSQSHVLKPIEHVLEKCMS